ncbi:hypothetical protein FRB95_006153, partial [Tulasnella sp. JGI-2019a]
MQPPPATIAEATLQDLTPYQINRCTLKIDKDSEIGRGLCVGVIPRSPVIIFVSDGMVGVNDDDVYDLRHRAVALAKPLSFHAVSFGTMNSPSSLRRMVDIAEQ